MYNSSKTQRIAGTALLAAIIIMLQTLSTFILRPGLIPINLVLPAIVVGAAMYGPKAGAFLGACFGTVVLFSGITGTAPMSGMMWTANPILMTIVTLGRGVAKGYVAGVVFAIFSKRKHQDGVLAAAIVTPIVNTGIFLAALIFLFRSTLVHFAGDTNILYHAFIVMAGTNFIIELFINVGLVSVIVRILDSIKITQRGATHGSGN